MTGNQESGRGDIEVGDIERQSGDCGGVIQDITDYLDLDLQDRVTIHVSCESSCNIAEVRSDLSPALGAVGQKAIDLGAHAVSVLYRCDVLKDCPGQR